MVHTDKFRPVSNKTSYNSVIVGKQQFFSTQDAVNTNKEIKFSALEGIIFIWHAEWHETRKMILGF